MADRADAQFGAAAQGVIHPGSDRAASWLRHFLAALMIVIALSASPALAHKGEKHGRQAPPASSVTQGGQAPSAAGETVPANPQGEAAPAPTGDTMDEMGMATDRSRMSFFERLYSWFGRLHPLIVHFPIAFFPAALFTAVVGRRRPAFAAPVQFLVVAGGIIAPVAAFAGWFAGLTAEPEPILAYHRWLGVTVGVAGAGLGLWAWRRPWEDRGAGMIAALALMTVAIAAQGFLGAGLTHGLEHLMF